MTVDQEGPRADAATVEKMLALLPDMVFTMRGDGTYSGFVQGSVLTPYVPPEHFLGKRIDEVIPEEIASESLRRIKVTLEKHEAQRFEYWLDDVELGIRLFEARMQPSGPDEVLVFVRDVTDERPARAEVDRLREALNEAKDALEYAAADLERDSDADHAVAGALGRIYRLEQDGPALLDVQEVRDGKAT